MSRHGFREIASADERPDIVLTVNYGRGFLRNPYLKGTILDEITPGMPSSTVTSPAQVMRKSGFDGEAKLQKAQEEKLFISVSAWQFPEKKGDKPNLFWRTVMVTDNLGGVDLNFAAPAMLAAGVPYFDRTIKEGEVGVDIRIPMGKVKLGPLNVVEEAVAR